ncbi:MULTISPECIES: DUF2141 domain-containing protein [unclassified Caulobacter]|uniref:DUF2141 domain-containing protein n=1 Tax=unclassified Caulobacter TaxID=2648921 RepID=UPI000D3914B3|nr:MULTISPECIES: DUF2141 domain-containing protein [unclassified Caulobacter]PTS88418.1 hypothetical protein DBR21_09490 [Caulobacter sp. HMWF009]PTT07365.1 hypothetical protein DBR10_10440 [Caulobacter sp. HMWF025]
MKARSALSGLAMTILCLGASAAQARADCEGRDSDTQLSVQISQVRSTTGEVVVTLYPSDPRRFLAPSGKLLRIRLRAAAPVTRVCFNLPEPDVYAVAVYHDANGNRDFDRNKVGMPVEGFGFSNDAPTRFGLPSFDAVRFSARAGETLLRIRMRYGK